MSEAAGTPVTGGAATGGNLYARVLAGLALLTMVVALPGCATYSAGFAKVEQAAAKRDLDGALKSLEELRLSGPDEPLLHLNRGTLLGLQGRYAESNRHFDLAKAMLERNSAISVAEQAASVTVNDTLKAYEGSPSEQLFIYSFKALNYLQMGEMDGAAVEARQFNVKQGLVAEKHKDVKYLSGAFVRYLNSMVYESIGERDSARIELQKAAAGYKFQGTGVTAPLMLERDLKRITGRKPPESEVVFILHNGLGASVVENNIRVSNPDYNPAVAGSIAMISIAVPKFVKRPLPVDRVVLSSGSHSATSEVVEDVNGIAEKSFNDGLPLIISRAVARAVVKNMAARKAKEENNNNPGSLGIFANLAADIAVNASERADTRSWSLLPGNIQMARLPLPAGKHDVTATYHGHDGRVIGSREFLGVEVRSGRKSFLSDFFL